MIQKPLVSIVMPVYNAGDFLSSAVESILNQTYRNWELIVVDDHSSDNSFSLLTEYSNKDRRIKVFENKRKGGVSATANFAISKAKGEFIARMDADDVAFPERIEKELAFLEKNSKFVAVGGQCYVIDRSGKMIGEKNFPREDRQIKKMIFTSIPLQQPTLMVNRKLLPKNFIWYDAKANTAEEVEFLFKLFSFGKIANLSEKILKYRIHGKNTSLVNPKKTFFLTVRTRILAIVKYQYRPTLTGILTTLGQTFIVLLLPGSLIYPLYSWVRGINLTPEKETIELAPSIE